MPKTTEIEVKVTASVTHQFLVFVQTTGRDEQGREVAPNGIRRKID